MVELLTNMTKKQVCLYQWDYENQNQNDNDKIDHINKTYTDQDLDIETTIGNTACFGKATSLCKKQHLSNI